MDSVAILANIFLHHQKKCYGKSLLNSKILPSQALKVVSRIWTSLLIEHTVWLVWCSSEWTKITNESVHIKSDIQNILRSG